VLTRVAIMGSSGYSGQECVRLLESHPRFKIVAQLGREDKAAAWAGKIDIVFLCTPNEVSLEQAPLFLKAGIHVIDLSGAFRLKKHAYPEWYGFEHTAPQELARAEYALYPWFKVKPAQAGGAPRLIANPGCFTTTVLTALIPLCRSGLIEMDPLFIDAKSGVTGAGRKAETRLLFSELYGEFTPYKVGKHQHWPELVEAVDQFASCAIKPVFVTELLPVARGISAALFGVWTSTAPDRLERLVASLKEAYAGMSDISVGTDPALASMKKVVGTNRVHVQVQEAFGKPVIFVVADNLLRGAAGQAVMNANQLAGYPVLEGVA
jgi:N-acetyl-gamma-glutamyl-phosphate reductase